MKTIEELVLPGGLRYAKDHEWVRPDGDTVRVGISDYAQDQLGDVVYVELPPAGERLEKGDVFGTVESVKAVSELIMPVGGEILAVNGELAQAPEWVNRDPYGRGWLIEVRVSDPGQMEDLMAVDAYAAMLRG